MSYYIPVNHKGPYIDCEPENGTNFTLEELYKKLDCKLIEVVSLQEGWILIIDEEGKLNGKKINDIATSYFRKAKPYVNDFIVGDVILCPSNLLK